MEGRIRRSHLHRLRSASAGGRRWRGTEEVRVDDDDDGGSRRDAVVAVELSTVAYGRLAEPLYARSRRLGEGAVVECRSRSAVEGDLEMEDGGEARVYGEKKRPCERAEIGRAHV